MNFKRVLGFEKKKKKEGDFICRYNNSSHSRASITRLYIPLYRNELRKLVIERFANDVVGRGGAVSKEHRALETVPILETEFRRIIKRFGSPWKRANVNISNRATRAHLECARGLIQRKPRPRPGFANAPRMKTCKQYISLSLPTRRIYSRVRVSLW